MHEKRTMAAFGAIDEFDVEKLWEALAMGVAAGDISNSDSNTLDLRSMSLIEYSVYKDFSGGVDIMLKVTFA